MKLVELSDREFRQHHTRQTVTMYYGTCRGRALALESGGFDPNTLSKIKELILVSTIDMAKKQAENSGCDSILELHNVSAAALHPMQYSPMENEESLDNMIQSIIRGDAVSAKLIAPHRQFKFLNKFRKSRNK